MAIDALPGSPTANSYLTVEEATVFLQDRLHVEAWYRVDPEGAITLLHRREAALMQATRLLETQVHWYGLPATTTQALAWPQTGHVDAYGRPVSLTTIPAAVQRATAYYALQLLEAETAAQAATQALQTGEGLIKSKQIGDMTITYQEASTARGSTGTTTPVSTRVPNEVWLLLRPYGLVPGFGSVPLIRT